MQVPATERSPLSAPPTNSGRRKSFARNRAGLEKEERSAKRSTACFRPTWLCGWGFEDTEGQRSGNNCGVAGCAIVLVTYSLLYKQRACSLRSQAAELLRNSAQEGRCPSWTSP